MKLTNRCLELTGQLLPGAIEIEHAEQHRREGIRYGEMEQEAARVRDVRETYEPMPGTDRALLPGAIEIEHAEQHRREGIRYGEMEQEAARVVSERLGVPLPWDE